MSKFNWAKFKDGEYAVEFSSRDSMADFLKECDKRNLVWASGNKPMEYFDMANVEDYISIVANDFYSQMGRIVNPKKTNTKYSDRTVIKWEDYMNVNNKIVIYQNENEVIAKNTKTEEIAKATCHKDDEFDFNIGAKLAVDRLLKTEDVKVEDTKYVEVKRKAKVGEFIKIVDCQDDRYKNGDVFKVSDTTPFANIFVEVGVRDNDRFMVYDSEYIVLENYKGKVNTELYNGQVVVVKTNDIGLTKGKIYTFVDGVSKWNDGTVLEKFDVPMGINKRPFKSFKDLKKWFKEDDDGTKVIEIVK